MKKFIYKIFAVSIIVIITFAGFSFLANGYTDPFYMRFTTPKQTSLILGTSRAAQGIQPAVFEDILGKKISNFAFTVANSPYGYIYLESIKRKINKKHGGFFIIAVSPWSISSRCKDPNDTTSFRENGLCLSNTTNISINPNIEYLYKNLQGSYIDLFLPQKHMFLHKDGWLEIKDIPMDSLTVSNRIKAKVKIYRDEVLPEMKLSSYRLNYLIKTISYLKQYGKVYIVRLPMHKDFMSIENKLMPNFDNTIKEAIEISNNYLDLTKDNDKYIYTDGNHLYKSSGKEVSKQIAEFIKKAN
ncbi:MAG: hypothetical protein DRI86_16220 [Bacteroidetes bacterium]|nr:MAG: hypothetical protein DRI86_16220 [Bacteroidota bacterium]